MSGAWQLEELIGELVGGNPLGTLPARIITRGQRYLVGDQHPDDPGRQPGYPAHCWMV